MEYYDKNHKILWVEDPLDNEYIKAVTYGLSVFGADFVNCLSTELRDRAVLSSIGGIESNMHIGFNVEWYEKVLKKIIEREKRKNPNIKKICTHYEGKEL